MSAPDYSSATASFTLGGLNIQASSPGAWGNDVSVSADVSGITDQVAELYNDMFGLQKSDLFNLNVYSNDKVVETFKCVTIKRIKNNSNRIDLTLEHESDYVRVMGEVPSSFSIPAAVKNQDGTTSAAKSTSSNAGNDGEFLTDSNDYLGDPATRTGLYALEKVDIFNILCIPPDPELPDSTLTAMNPTAAAFCEKKRALFIAEPLEVWKASAETGQWPSIQPTNLEINGDTARFATTYFPKVKMPDPEMQDRVRVFSSCGIIAGVMATNDLNRGVWKAPAGQDAGMVGVTGLEVKVNDADNGFLNPLGINCLRDFPVIGPVVWGDRTLRGADMLSDDYKYVSVRRLTNYIEESLKRGTQWAVFEDNDESLWSQLRLSIGAFMKELSVQGAFYNYKVICDASTTTPDDIAKGIVNVEILFAPVKPAEFVILKFQQTAATA
jgi:Bacteriophage tail sheath protein